MDKRYKVAGDKFYCITSGWDVQETTISRHEQKDRYHYVTSSS
jgi:hypothetical protein